jgi:cbb3-type cytochrome oxidase subunit 1
MNWSKFYYDFAAAYGSFWLAVMGIAVLTQSHVNAGAFGMFGFTLIAAIYALVKNPVTLSRTNNAEDEIQQLNDRIARLEQNQSNSM